MRQSLAKQPVMNKQLTPGGTLEYNVHSELDAQNRKALQDGEKTMKTMQQHFRSELEKVRNEGLNRAQFNQLSHTPVGGQTLSP